MRFLFPVGVRFIEILTNLYYSLLQRRSQVNFGLILKFVKFKLVLNSVFFLQNILTHFDVKYITLTLLKSPFEITYKVIIAVPLSPLYHRHTSRDTGVRCAWAAAGRCSRVRVGEQRTSRMSRAAYRGFSANGASAQRLAQDSFPAIAIRPRSLISRYLDGHRHRSDLTCPRHCIVDFALRN